MSVLDDKVVTELKELMGEDYVSVFDAFVRSADSALQELKKSVNELDCKTVEQITHTLKGSSANIGAKKLSQVCADMLEDARNLKVDQFHSQLDMVVAEYGAVVESIANLAK